MEPKPFHKTTRIGNKKNSRDRQLPVPAVFMVTLFLWKPYFMGHCITMPPQLPLMKLIFQQLFADASAVGINYFYKIQTILQA